MIKTILGSKNETTQVFLEGMRIPATKVTAGPCVVTQVKKMDRDGYWALQLGFGTKRIKNITKPLQGHFKKASISPRFIKEVRLKEEPKENVGDAVKVSDIFKSGDVVSVTGVSKGKGFAGGVKRYHFKGGPRTHGQSDRERAPGSIGQTTTPGRVYRGKRMAGRMGGEQKTVTNMHILSVNPETNELVISGFIPGHPGSFVSVEKIKEGSLKELEHEVVAQVVEGEAVPEEGSSEAPAEAPKEGGTENA